MIYKEFLDFTADEPTPRDGSPVTLAPRPMLPRRTRAAALKARMRPGLRGPTCSGHTDRTTLVAVGRSAGGEPAASRGLSAPGDRGPRSDRQRNFHCS